MNTINDHTEEAFGPDFLLTAVTELFLIDFSCSSPVYFVAQVCSRQTSYSSDFITQKLFVEGKITKEIGKILRL